MNYQDLTGILSKYYDKVDHVNGYEHIIRCEKHYKNKPYQIFHFDYSHHLVNTSNVNFEQYFEQYLTKLFADDYYSNAGFLQWNYYLIFLNDSIVDDNKEIIEKNEKYARKFILDYNELEDWLNKKYNIEPYQSSIINKDLSLLWINKLKENDLDCVYLKNITYKDGVNSFISGAPIKDFDEIEEFGASTQFEIEHENVDAIKKIILENYRTYPRDNEFDFGKVNLLFGPNGSGKTSLLEAIELFTCGKNSRDSAKPDDSTRINVIFKGDSKLKNLEIHNIKKYKLRDEYWYNNPDQIRNNLDISFNKFNFYNTDSAFNLSNVKGTSGEINKSFEDIALGRNVNFIEKRLMRYFEKFKDELRWCNDKISEYKMELNNENDFISKLKKDNHNSDILFNQFIEEVKKNHWNGSLPETPTDSLIIFEKDYSKVKLYLINLLEDINWLENPTINLLKAENIKLTKINKQIWKLNEEITTINDNLIECNNSHDRLNNLFQNLNKFKKYQHLENINDLIGLNEKIEKISAKEIKYGNLISIIKNINISFFESVDITLNEYKEKLIADISMKHLDSEDLKYKIEKLEKGLSELESIIGEINSKGKEFIAISPDSIFCPLCDAKYTKNELKSRIESSCKNIEKSNILSELIVQQDELTKNLNDLQSQLIVLSNIEEAISRIQVFENPSECALFVIIERLKLANEEHLRIQTELQNLMILKERLNIEGYSENEFEDLSRKLLNCELNYLNSFNEVEKKANNYRLSSYKKKYNEIQVEIDKNNFKMNELNNIKSMMVEKYFKNVERDGHHLIIKNRIEKINYSIQLLEDISNLISIPSDIPLKEVKINIDIVYDIFEKFKNEFNENTNINKIVENEIKQIQEYNIKIEQMINRKKIIKKGHDTIKDIFASNGKEKHLEEFIQQNKNEIAHIFKIIHSPKEFEKINFSKDSHITLKRIESSKYEELTKMSTGQRSALSLSIFISLNQKLRNAPPYILFDDPISFIDDLNVLSFIDYLREIVLNSEKQIFFATANEDLAFLFTQKFSFLGDSEFKRIELKR